MSSANTIHTLEFNIIALRVKERLKYFFTLIFSLLSHFFKDFSVLLLVVFPEFDYVIYIYKIEFLDFLSSAANPIHQFASSN